MSNLAIEYPVDAKSSRRRPKPSRRRLRRLPFRLLRWVALVIVLAVVPFFLLIRGGVFAYHQWGLGAWPSLAVSAAATALLLALYAWAMGRRIRAGKGLKWLMTRGAAAIGIDGVFELAPSNNGTADTLSRIEAAAARAVAALTGGKRNGS